MSNDLWAGVDIGGTKTAVLLSAHPPALLARIEFPTLPLDGPQPAIQRIKQALREMLVSQGTTPAALSAIGVSCGSPQDRARGVIQAPPNLPTWVDVPIADILAESFGAPCLLENDANAGAVAEHRFGAGQGVQDMVFLTLGTGLGAGLILRGTLYHGACDYAGEIGHIRLTPAGPVGHNKAGSAEGWTSGAGIAQLAAQSLESARREGRHTALPEGASARDVGEAARNGDGLAREIILTAGRRLGATIAILVDILNPELIVVGGLALRLGDAILEPARAAMHEEALRENAAACRIVPAALGERIGDVAALCIAMGYCDPARQSGRTVLAAGSR